MKKIIKLLLLIHYKRYQISNIRNLGNRTLPILKGIMIGVSTTSISTRSIQWIHLVVSSLWTLHQLEANKLRTRNIQISVEKFRILINSLLLNFMTNKIEPHTKEMKKLQRRISDQTLMAQTQRSVIRTSKVTKNLPQFQKIRTYRPNQLPDTL
jgi:hypothetical protein